jgi:hypothetical protein
MVSRMIHESYGVEKYYDSHIGSTTYLLRVLKNRVPQGNEPNIAFVTHTDKSFTTILHQNQVNGLEVETKDGNWINVEFSPSSFVVIAGDALMVGHYHLIWCLLGAKEIDVGWQLSIFGFKHNHSSANPVDEIADKPFCVR